MFVCDDQSWLWDVYGEYVDHFKWGSRRTGSWARDPTKQVRCDRTFDLAVCLEVGELLGTRSWLNKPCAFLRDVRVLNEIGTQPGGAQAPLCVTLRCGTERDSRSD